MIIKLNVGIDLAEAQCSPNNKTGPQETWPLLNIQIRDSLGVDIGHIFGIYKISVPGPCHMFLYCCSIGTTKKGIGPTYSSKVRLTSTLLDKHEI